MIKEIYLDNVKNLEQLNRKCVICDKQFSMIDRPYFNKFHIATNPELNFCSNKCYLVMINESMEFE